MKVQSLLVGLLVVGVSVWLTATVVSAGDPKDMTPEEMQKYMQDPEVQAKMMEEWMKLASPGKNHKALEPFVGEWNIELKSWWGGPQAPATVAKGKSKSQWIMDGRYVQEEFTCKMPMPSPTGEQHMMDFRGMGLMGYDNFRNMYTSMWLDNMGTAIYVSKGAVDMSGKKFTYYGEMDEPMLNVVGRYTRIVTEVINNDKHVMRMYDLHAGENYKVMEITYTRR